MSFPINDMTSQFGNQQVAMLQAVPQDINYYADALNKFAPDVAAAIQAGTTSQQQQANASYLNAQAYKDLTSTQMMQQALKYFAGNQQAPQTQNQPPSAYQQQLQLQPSQLQMPTSPSVAGDQLYGSGANWPVPQQIGNPSPQGMPSAMAVPQTNYQQPQQQPQNPGIDLNDPVAAILGHAAGIDPTVYEGLRKFQEREKDKTAKQNWIYQMYGRTPETEAIANTVTGDEDADMMGKVIDLHMRGLTDKYAGDVSRFVTDMRKATTSKAFLARQKAAEAAGIAPDKITAETYANGLQGASYMNPDLKKELGLALAKKGPAGIDEFIDKAWDAHDKHIESFAKSNLDQAKAGESKNIGAYYKAAADTLPSLRKSQEDKNETSTNTDSTKTTLEILKTRLSTVSNRRAETQQQINTLKNRVIELDQDPHSIIKGSDVYKQKEDAIRQMADLAKYSDDDKNEINDISQQLAKLQNPGTASANLPAALPTESPEDNVNPADIFKSPLNTPNILPQPKGTPVTQTKKSSILQRLDRLDSLMNPK